MKPEVRIVRTPFRRGYYYRVERKVNFLGFKFWRFWSLEWSPAIARIEAGKLYKRLLENNQELEKDTVVWYNGNEWKRPTLREGKELSMIKKGDGE
jgi:hypothetical protein